MPAPSWQWCAAGAVAGLAVSAVAVADGIARAINANASVKRLMAGILRRHAAGCEKLADLVVRGL